MIQALLVSSDKNRLSSLETVLSENKVETVWAASGFEALSSMAEQHYDLVAADEQLPDMSGLELAEKTLLKHPMSNFAVVSALSREDFHEASEGMGILMQLSPETGRDEAGMLLDHLKSILRLMGTSA